MIKIEGLHYHYPKGRKVLDNIALNFVPGAIYGLFGKNGEGKSTLMKIMAGLLFPRAGSCHALGENTAKRTVKHLQDVFIVPEDFELPALKIATYMKINAPFYPRFSSNQFYELIKEFRLSPNDKISTLSFGQKKKVLIAFSIAANTKLLLMDEPTNGLDIPSKSQFRKIMASVVDHEKCIIISTHQVRDLHSLIDHIVILDQARVTFNESLYNVSERICFGKPSAENQQSIIYSETSFGGKAVFARQDENETEVDLELLFNAVLTDPNRINNVLKNNYNDTTI